MAESLDILFVNPNGKKKAYGCLGNTLSAIEPPWWCGLKAAVARENGFSVKILDAEAENLSPEDTAKRIAKESPLLVEIVVMGINPSASSTPKMTAVRELLTSLKEIYPEANTLLSGLHPSAVPDKTLEEGAKFVCVGEGFDTTLKLIETLKKGEKDYKINGLWYKDNGSVISNPPSVPLKNLDDLPFIAWDLMPMDKYRAHNWHCFQDIDHRSPYGVIYTSLGCPYNCSYCNIHALYGRPGIRYRNIEKVVQEIGILTGEYKIKNIKIIDELFVLREDRVKEFCNLIIDHGYDLNMWAYARVDTVNESILEKMKPAGINWLCYGFESASSKVREGVEKRYEQERIEKTVEITRRHEINILGNFIFGLPDDDHKSMRETLDMAKRFNFEYVNFYVAVAYPGSKLYEEAVAKGVPLPKDWYAYSQYSEDLIPLPTKYLTPAEVLRFRDNAFIEYFSNPKYLEMIEKKFGSKVVEHIKEMLKYRIKRRLLLNDNFENAF